MNEEQEVQNKTPFPADNDPVAEGAEKFPEESLTVPASDFEKLKAEHEALKLAHSSLNETAAVNADLVTQAHEDSKAFIHQVDREGLGMATVTDHRKRVDKFLDRLSKLGRA